MKKIQEILGKYTHKIKNALSRHLKTVVFTVIWMIVIAFAVVLVLISSNLEDATLKYSYLLYAFITVGFGYLLTFYFKSLIKNRDETLTHLTIYIYVIILFSIPVTYLVILNGWNYISKMPGFIIIGSYSDWISFIGSILAGVITMIGITLTLKKQLLIRDEDNKNLLIPMIDVRIESLDEDMDPENSRYLNIQSSWYFVIVNKYRNVARNVTINKITIKFSNNYKDDKSWCNDINLNLDSRVVKKFLAIDENFMVEICPDFSQFPKSKFDFMLISVEISYFDISGKNEFIHNSEFVYREDGNSGQVFKYSEWESLLSSHDRDILDEISD